MDIVNELNEWAYGSEDFTSDTSPLNRMYHHGLPYNPFDIKEGEYVTFFYYNYRKQEVRKSLREDRIETDKYLLEYISPILIKHNMYQFNTIDTPNSDSRTIIWKYTSTGKWITEIGQLQFNF